MTRITWIIIILIVLSICVTCLEVLLRFAILSAKGKAGAAVGEGVVAGASVAGKLARVSPPSYAGPSLLAARSVVWVGSGVKGLFV